jgi:preprotein translocase subunit SecE
VARNRKRAKERRARRPQPVIGGRTERDDSAPNPIGHASPDVELAEAQLALGRPELSGEAEPDDEQFEQELEREAADSGDGAGGEPPTGLALEGGGRSSGGGGEVVSRRGFPGYRLIGFLQGSWRELQRVQWPDRRQVMQATGVVIGFVIVAGVFLGIADEIAGKLVTLILK